MFSVLVTGGSGKLGSSLKKVFPKALFPSHFQLEVTNPKSVFSYFKKFKPKLIIHAAALADVKACEKDKKLAWKTNVEGTRNLIEASEKLSLSAYFVYISTACVFYGDKGGYSEEDVPYPKNFYSLTKLVGELVVQESRLKKYLIIRTNFVLKAPWPYPRAFTDRFGTYLFADDVAKGIKELTSAKMTGVVHLTGNKKMSMYELAKTLSPNIRPITLKEYQGPPLTVDMSLTTKRWKKYKISRESPN